MVYLVSIDYRLEYEVTKEQIFEMFKSMGYIHLRTKKRAVKKGQRWIAAEELIKVTEEGRVHIFVEFSTKSSGNEAYPQIDVHAHYDYVKKEGEKEYHITRRNIMKDLREMFEIHDMLKHYGYGYMEYKSLYSAHNTIKTKKRDQLARILINDDYHYDADGKYKKRILEGQITFQIIEQHFFSHTVCVYAIGEKHDLSREKAIQESDRIMENLAIYTNKVEFIIKEKEGLQKSLQLIKSDRNNLNKKTQEIITVIKEKEASIVKEQNWKKKKNIINKKRKIEKKLIKNKKLADQKHTEYLEVKKQIVTLNNQIKKLKKNLFLEM